MQRKLIFFMLLLGVADARAQLCPSSLFGVSLCSGGACNILIDVRPSGVVRVLPDSRYGTGMNINFGTDSVFQLGDNGRINFGNSGGMQAVAVPNTALATCTAFSSGLQLYAVNMNSGGWLDFSGNNQIALKANNIFALGGGSKIDGRLDIQSDGTVSIGSPSGGDMTMPNVDINAKLGITLSGQGDIRIGNLTNQGTPPGSNQGINIVSEGDVTLGTVDSNDDFSVTADGNITIGAIKNADSIALVINPPHTGVIKIGNQQTTDNPVMCASAEDCSNFQVTGDGSSEVNDCNTVNSDPEAANNCGGGTPGAEFILLCFAVCCRRRMRLQ
ncbi:MAG TPA: hypothetical protein VGL10_05225 [Gammaproteobacteria bacterium]